MLSFCIFKNLLKKKKKKKGFFHTIIISEVKFVQTGPIKKKQEEKKRGPISFMQICSIFHGSTSLRFTLQ